MATEQMRVSTKAKTLIHNERGVGESYSDCIERIFEFHRLNPEEMIGQLAEILLKTRKDLKNKNKIFDVLQQSPFIYTHQGSAGKTNHSLTATVTLPNGEERELVGAEEHKSNYAHEGTQKGTFGSSELRELKDQPIVVQLSYLYQKYKGSLKVKAHFTLEDCWEGQDCDDPEGWFITFSFP